MDALMLKQISADSYTPVLETTDLRAFCQKKWGRAANLTITYEDHVLHDPMVGYEMICKTIDLPSVQPTIDLQRTNPGRIDDLVAQPAALRERLSGTRWAWMLESE